MFPFFDHFLKQNLGQAVPPDYTNQGRELLTDMEL